MGIELAMPISDGQKAEFLRFLWSWRLSHESTWDVQPLSSPPRYKMELDNCFRWTLAEALCRDKRIPGGHQERQDLWMRVLCHADTMRTGDVAWTASNVTIGNIPHYVLRSVRKLESNITPKTLFESGKYRDIETASEVFILMKKIGRR